MPNLNRLFRGPMAYLLLILVLVFLLLPVLRRQSPGRAGPPLRRGQEHRGQRVKDAVLKDQDQKITGTYNDGRKFEAA